MSRNSLTTLMFTLFIGLALAAVQPAPGATIPTAAGYAVTDLGSLGSGKTVPVAINVRGDVAGYSTTTAGQVHAFLLPAGGRMQDLGTLGGTTSYATSLNNRGDVAGYFITTTGQTHAFAILDGRATDLGVTIGVASKALGINDLRQVLVVSDAGGGNAASALWQNGQMTLLGTLGGSSTAGGGLNNLGQVVGNAAASDGSNHAFVTDATTQRLLDLGEIGPGGTLLHANEIGQAVGIRINRGANIAFGADLPMGILDDEIVRRGYSGTDVYWINNENMAAGGGERPSPSASDAGIWAPVDQFTKLNETALLPNSGWVLLSANAISDAGVIVGRAVGPDAVAVAYMLTATGPELPGDRALATANSLAPVIAAVQNAGAAATAPTALATTLVDLQQARSLLTPGARETTLTGARSGQAVHLLRSSRNLLLSIADNSPLLAPSDRDSSIATVNAALSALQ